MKLHCQKCRKQLTSDLRPVKIKRNEYGRILNCKDVYEGSLHSEDEYVGGDPNVTWWEWDNMKKGIFYITKREKFNWTEKDNRIKGYYRIIKRREKFVVAETSILQGVIPPNPKNCCCNWCMGEVLKCSCGYVIGQMYLDCYEDGRVEFYTDKVTRSYK